MAYHATSSDAHGRLLTAVLHLTKDRQCGTYGMGHSLTPLYNAFAAAFCAERNMPPIGKLDMTDHLPTI